MNETSDDLQLRRQLRALAQDRPPRRDLWPAIAAALPAQRRSARWRRPGPALSALAAGTVLALGLALVPLPVADRAPPSNLDTPAAPAPDSAQVLLTAYDQVLAAERDWRRQQPPPATAPGALERIAAARELDASLAQLAAALRIEPQSQLLRRLMHQTLQQRTALTRDSFAA
jgi:hypothetical protein